MKKLLAVALLTVAAGAAAAMTGCGTATSLTGAPARVAQTAQARDAQSDLEKGDRLYMVSGFKGELLKVEPGLDEGVLRLTLKAVKGSKNGGSFSADFSPHYEHEPLMNLEDLKVGAVIGADVHYPLVARNKTKDILKAATVARLTLVKAAK
jgi:hypothetical protein